MTIFASERARREGRKEGRMEGRKEGRKEAYTNCKAQSSSEKH